MWNSNPGRWPKALTTLPLLLLGLLPACSTTLDLPTGTNGPITYQHFTRHNPNQAIYVARVNLADPRVTVRVAPGGPDPDGAGPWVTTLLPTSEIAERDHFDLAVNGDFFEAENTKDIEGKKTGYIRGKSAAPVGPAMTEGKLWHSSRTPRPVLEVTAMKVAKLVEIGPSGPVDAGAMEIIGGGQIILRHGEPVLSKAKFTNQRHPRTAVGLDKTGTLLTLVVVDGRQPKHAIGMTLPELTAVMLELGCDSALNLDGGGSSTMVYRNSRTGRLKIMNSPSDTKERSVADVLGVKVK